MLYSTVVSGAGYQVRCGQICMCCQGEVSTVTPVSCADVMSIHTCTGNKGNIIEDHFLISQYLPTTVQLSRNMSYIHTYIHTYIDHKEEH